MALKPKKSALLFLSWLKQENMPLYYAVLEKIKRPGGLHTIKGGMPGQTPPIMAPRRKKALTLGENEDDSSWFNFDTITSALSSVGTAYLGYQAQKNLIELNTQRMAAGQPPLTQEQSAAAAPVAVKVVHEVDPSVTKEIGTELSTLTDYLPWMAAGLGLILLLPRLLKK